MFGSGRWAKKPFHLSKYEMYCDLLCSYGYFGGFALISGAIAVDPDNWSDRSWPMRVGMSYPVLMGVNIAQKGDSLVRHGFATGERSCPGQYHI